MKKVTAIYYNNGNNSIWIKQDDVYFCDLPSVGDIFKHPNSGASFFITNRHVTESVVRIYVENASDKEKELKIDLFKEADTPSSKTNSF